MNIIQNHLGKLISVGVLAVLGMVAISAYYGAFNYGADAETTIDAEYKNLEVLLATHSQKVMEVAQVPAMYKDDLKEVMTSVMAARQGEGGSQAAFQWFKEHEVNISAEMYTKIQQIIESGRNKFQNGQTKFIDTKRVYVATLKKDLFLSRGWWLGVTGYPSINVGFPNGATDDYPIISSGHAQEAFESGVDNGLQLR